MGFKYMYKELYVYMII